MTAVASPKPDRRDFVIYESVRDPATYVAAYNELMREPTNRLRVQAVTDALRRIDVPIARVVDVASGGGAYTRSAQEHVPALRNARFVPVDRQFACVRGYHLNHPASAGVLADVTALPFQTAAFDLALCLDIIEHLEDDVEFLRGVARVLKPGGWVLISTHNNWSLEHVVGLTTSAIRRKKWRGWDPTHLRFYNRHALERVLRQVGFESVAFRGTYFFPFHLPARVASWPFARIGFPRAQRLVYDLVKTPGYALNALLEKLAARGPFRYAGWGIVVVARKQ